MDDSCLKNYTLSCSFPVDLPVAWPDPPYVRPAGTALSIIMPSTCMESNMVERINLSRTTALKTIVMALAALTFLLQPYGAACADPPSPASRAPQQKMQAMVMGMADEYIAALGEAMYLVTNSSSLDAKGRWLTMSFLRNGVGASLDIAVGPNPPVNLLDLLVLTSLQTWSFQTHWIQQGIGDAGKPAVSRLKQAEASAWANARKVLSEEQLRTVKRLIETWIAENPDRTVVSLVRFNDFADERKISSLSLRGQAHGLLSEVSEATAAVDDVRLLGERLLWFAGRYPYLLGEQSELTAYRILDKPEVRQLVEASSSAQQLSETLGKRLAAIDNDLKAQKEHVFKLIATERSAAIDQLKKSLDASLDKAFQKFSAERKELLKNLAEREKEAIVVMGDLRQTLAVSETTAKEVAATTREMEKLLGRYQSIQNNSKERIRLEDIRESAIETGRTAEKLTLLLAQVNSVLDSKSLDRTINAMNNPIDRLIDRAFWRIVALICLLIFGLGILRLLPKR